MLQIGRFTAQYRLPAALPDPRAAKDALDRLIERELPVALDRRLGERDSAAGEAIWLIRRLSTDIEINLGWPPEEIAGRWAAAVAREISAAMAQESESSGVLYFPSEAAYLARYLVDRATAQAAGKWYYRRFEGLAVLPASAAIRTALTGDRALGMRAAALMSEGEWQTVVSALSDAEAVRILRAWNHAAEPVETLRDLWRIWIEAGLDGASARRPHRALLLLRAAMRSRAEFAERPPALAVLSLCELVALLAESGPRAAARLVDLIAAGEIAQLYRLVGPEIGELLSPWAGAPRDLLDEIAQRPPAARRDRFVTRFGGLFLLLPLLADMPFDEMAETLPAAEATPAAAVMRYLVAIKCLSHERAGDLLSDAAVRRFCGVDEACDASALAAWLAAAGPALPRSSVVLDDWLRREGLVRGDTQRVSMPGHPFVATVDLYRGIWLSLEPTAGRPDVPPLDDAATDPQSRRLRLIGAEVEYLEFPPGLAAGEPADLFFTRLAVILLRNFSWRLPGFHAASIPYLAANLLDFAASIEREEETFHVKLARPPLHIVLGIAGMMEREFELPWLPDVVISTSAEREA